MHHLSATMLLPSSLSCRNLHCDKKSWGVVIAYRCPRQLYSSSGVIAAVATVSMLLRCRRRWERTAGNIIPIHGTRHRPSPQPQRQCHWLRLQKNIPHILTRLSLDCQQQNRHDDMKIIPNAGHDGRVVPPTAGDGDKRAGG